MSEATEQPSFVHMVFFTVKDNSDELAERLLAGCNEFLNNHPGLTHFSAGRRATDYQRPVNDQTFGVAVVLVFESEADHDRYQVSDRHQEFLSKCSPCWSEVRVFDAFC